MTSLQPNKLVSLTTPKTALTLHALTPAKLKTWQKRQSEAVRSWIKASRFKASAGSHVMVPDAKGNPSLILVGVSEPISLWDLSVLPAKLRTGSYALTGVTKQDDVQKLTLGWLLGCYQFSLYKKHEDISAKLCLQSKINLSKVKDMAASIALSRDLISTPAEDLGPAEMASAIMKISKKYGAKTSQIIGDKLLEKNYPAIHRVGRASPRKPRLVDLKWGNPKHPKVTLVGKGVCYDTGGLDIKPSSGMMLMRKDMGGAAVAIGLAHMIMARKLPVRLRLLVPTVDNAIDGNAYRSSDVIKMRNGLTVEVGNTDAEGRLILADALAEAATEGPDTLIDFATLTGAARVAVGTEISAFFTEEDKLADTYAKQANITEDPIWRLPLHQSYKKTLQTPFADLNSCPATGFAGATTAALFLQRFVGKTKQWIHLDFMGWNISSKPGRPQGGEAMSLRATFKLLEKLYTSA